MKSIVPLIALTLACAACAGEPAPERAQTPAAASRTLAEPAVAAVRPDVTMGGNGSTVAPAPRAAEAAPFQPDRPPTASSNPTRPPAAAAPSHQPEARRISAAELGPMIERGEALLVDVRGATEWTYRRAAGAVHIPYPDLFTRSVELPHEKLIALYCT